MAGSSWILLAGNAIVASTLLLAASAKLVSPLALSRSLTQVTGRAALSSREVVRGIGILEAAIALGVLIEPVRPTSAVLLAVLGLSFLALGIAGRVRDANEPCGCFGAASQRPLGYQNVGLGLVICAVGVANLLISYQPSDDARAAAPILTAALLCLACMVTGRSVLWPAAKVSN
jgi:hypothetical protein